MAGRALAPQALFAITVLVSLIAVGTQPATADDAPAVLLTRPGHGETAIDPSAPMQVTFSEPMDHPSAEAAFSLNPAANGSFTWSGDTMIYRVPGGLQRGVWYGAALSATAVSLAGETLPSPVFFGFLTSPVVTDPFTLTGTVSSDSGAPLAGVTVEALLRENGTRAGVTFTDESGGFAMTLEASRAYRLRFTREGLEPWEIDSVGGPGDHQVTLRSSRPVAGGGPFTLGVVITGAAVGGVVLATFYIVDALRFALFSVSASMMMRMGREKVLDQFVRGQVFGAIVLKPGINYTEIRRTLRIANGQLAYHLHVLLKEEFVVSRRVVSHVCFFPAGVPVDIGAGMRLSPLQERIVVLLRSTPGITQTDLAARLDRPVKTIHYNVSRLQKQGMLRVERAGKGSACYAVDPPPAPAKQVDVNAI